MALVWSILKPLAYISVTVVAVRGILWGRSSRMRYVVRVAGYTLALFATGVWAAGVAAGMALLGRQYDVNYVVARSFYHLVRTTLGLEVEVEGEERLWTTRPAVLMCNHQSMVDVLILGR
jgi:lysophosphatidate acyltransferase